MATLTSSLIIDAYYLSSVVSESLEFVSGDQVTKGLKYLNEILDFQTADYRLIPYYGTYVFNSVPTQEKYFIPNLIYPETLTFVIGAVRYSMYSQTRDIYFGSARANNVYSLPYQYFFERTLDGCDVYLYMPPTDIYEFTAYGKFSLANVTLTQDLELTLDGYYLQYLRYELASYIAENYQISFPPENKMKLEKYRSIVFDTSPIDLTMKKRSILQSRDGISPDLYAQANVGRGFMPPTS